ncbi:DHA2 family efflux MFS transporter permease subunit [Williamsia sp. MIQD14]|uniref:DHA2 family efflux MFS transporter permease subunit n=1 Tax=Williamsia sp. MIQD14 TaxID=3425703 RepID=UPI003DA09B16
MTSTSTDDATTTVARRAWPAFAACLVAVFMQMVDTTIVNIALPDLTTDLGASSADQLLVLTVYTLAFACTLMTASRIGERLGRRRVFIAALAGFTLASLLCGTAAGPGELIAARGLQGACAAFASAQTIAIISAIFPRARHGLVFGVYGATAGVAAMLGPVLGGALVGLDAFGLGWRTIFLVNLPFGIIACVIAARAMPPVVGTLRESLDAVGVALSTVGLFLLIYPLSTGREKGWPVWLLGMLVLSVAVLVAFVLHERALLRRGGAPLLRLDLFAERSFAVGAVLSLLFFSVFTAFFFTVSITTQFGLGYSPLHTGLITLPFALGAAVGSLLSPLVVTRIGPRTLTVGMVVFAVSVAWMAVVIDPARHDIALATLIAPLVLGGLGTGIFVAPLQAVILSGTTSRTVGSASGTIPTVQQIGGSVGLAIIGIVFFALVGSASSAGASAGADDLRTRLGDTAVPAVAQPVVVSRFSDCVSRQLSSPRPEVSPPGCSTQAGAATEAGPQAAIIRAAQPALQPAARVAAARAFLEAFSTIMWIICATAAAVAALSLAVPRARVTVPVGTPASVG